VTDRLYLTQPALEADTEVLSCTPLEDGRYAVRLAATPFHPQGGGQPSDVGWLGEVEVTKVVSEGDEIIHYTSAAVAAGPIRARVDAQPRQLHARLHSGGHVIGYVMAQLGWRATKAHHWPGEGRVVGVSAPDAGAQELEAAEIECRCNALIADDLACALSSEGGRRQIGFGALPAYPCGGTHVASLGEIGRIAIQSVRVKKGEASIRYDVVA
jgi:alanyl-tRNA synthetase